MDRLDDLQVYRKLHSLVEDLDVLADKAASPAAGTAIRAASKLVKILASGLYKQSIEAMTNSVEN